MHSDIYEKLGSVAQSRGTIAYGEVAPLAGLDMSNPADRNEIARILGEISTYEHEQGHPMLSAVVVLNDSGLPGTGFFTLAGDLGKFDGTDDLAFFAGELRRVHDHWAVASASAGERFPP